MAHKQKVYIAADDYNFAWTDFKVTQVMQLWQHGYSIQNIAKKVNRHQIEVAILVMDLAEKGHLLPRVHGAYWDKVVAT